MRFVSVIVLWYKEVSNVSLVISDFRFIKGQVDWSSNMLIKSFGDTVCFNRLDFIKRKYAKEVV